MSKSQVRSHLTVLEKKVSVILSIVYSLRLLGIFLLLPVFSLYASQLSGGDNRFWIGLAFGLYGLMQAVCQLPLGILSDRFGRKKMIVIGLAVFAAGSFLCAFADNIFTLSIARAVQGAGAVSAAVVALLADITRDEVRTRAMSLIGASIGLTFSGSLIIAPVLDRWIGVGGVFILTGIGAIMGILLILFAIPETNIRQPEKMNFAAVFANRHLWQLNFGIFALHAAQMAMFVALPFVLQDLGFIKADLWKIYFPRTKSTIFPNESFAPTFFEISSSFLPTATLSSFTNIWSTKQISDKCLLILPCKMPSLTFCGLEAIFSSCAICAAKISFCSSM